MRNRLVDQRKLCKKELRGPSGVIVFGIILAFLIVAMPGGLSVANALAPEDVEADVALLVVAETNQVLLEKNADKVVEPASIAKIMTMLLALDAVEKGESSLTDEIIVSPDAEAIGGSQVWLRAGEVFTLEQLLKAVAIQSANDAAYAVAEHVTGSVPAFVKQMNRRAEELGMDHTHFTNVHGLPPETGQEPTVSTANDINKMAQALLKFPVVLEWTSTWSEVFRSSEPRTMLYNTNTLLREYPGLDGLKTGHTSSAGFCLVATAKRDDLRLVSIVMGTPGDAERRNQTRRLLDYGFKGFIQRRLVEAGEVVGEAVIKNGSPERVNVKASVDLNALVEKGSTGEIRQELQFLPEVKAPLTAGEPVGMLVATIDDYRLGEVPIVVEQDVRTAGIFARIWRWIRDLVRSMVRTES